MASPFVVFDFDERNGNYGNDGIYVTRRFSLWVLTTKS